MILYNYNDEEKIMGKKAGLFSKKTAIREGLDTGFDFTDDEAYLCRVAHALTENGVLSPPENTDDLPLAA